MGLAGICYLGATVLLCVLFVAIVARTYSRRHRERGESPKYRMMDDE